MAKKKNSNLKNNNQIKNQEITNEHKDINKAKNVEKIEDQTNDKVIESFSTEKKTNIDEEIQAIKDKKKGKVETIKEEKVEKPKEENNKENSFKNDLDLFSMIEDEDTTEIEIKDDNSQQEFMDNPKKNTKKEEIKFDNKVLMESPKKSKFSIFLLVISLLAIIYYGVITYLHLDFANLAMADLIKSGTFILISLLIILILFKVNSKKLTPYVFIITLILIGYTLFSTSYALPTKSDNYVLDFVNKEVTEVMDWADANNIELEILHEFSDTVLKNHVIMQEYGITTPVSSIKKPFKITISDGPNYDKTLTVSNLTGLTFDEVMAYIKENKLNNVEIEFVVSDMPRDTVIEQVGSGTLKRNDKIIIKFSYGPDQIEPTPVKDLKNLSEFEATAYLKRYNIPYEIVYEFDKNIEKGYVLKQNIVNEIVTDKLILTISKGLEIVVPNLTSMSTTEITKWAMNNNINIIFNEEYNKEYANGKVIKADKAEGDKINEGDTITVTISKGSMIMPKIENLAEFKLWANDNNVKYEEVYEFSTSHKSGEIIKVEPSEGTKLSENDTVVITISRGKQITIPNFVGMSKSNIQARCNSLNLVCSFVYGNYTENTARDIALTQSKKNGTEVAEGTNLTITLSSGILEKVNIPSFIGKSKNQITNSCSELGITCNFTYNSDYSNEAKDTAIKQDKTGTAYKGTTVSITLSIGPAQTYSNIIIDGSLLSYGSPEQTKNTLKKYLEEECPGVNFIFSFQSINSQEGGAGYLNINSEVHVGSNTFVQGRTYKVIINTFA